MPGPDAVARNAILAAERARRLGAAGVLPVDVRYAVVELAFDAGGPRGFACALCGGLGRFAFRLRVERDRGPVVEPVGRSCVMAWANGLPASPARDAFLRAARKAWKRVDNARRRPQDAAQIAARRHARLAALGREAITEQELEAARAAGASDAEAVRVAAGARHEAARAALRAALALRAGADAPAALRAMDLRADAAPGVAAVLRALAAGRPVTAAEREHLARAVEGRSAQPS